MKICSYNVNTEGIDYFVGDIHGEYHKLIDALYRVGFDTEVDRLFSVGDLIDRGPDSLECLSLIEESWFYPIKGNHEQMAIDAIFLEDDRERFRARQMWSTSGGDWYSGLPYESQLRAKHLISEANELPDGIRVGEVGVLHAECPLQYWDVLELDTGKYLREHCMWARRRIDRKDNWKVRDIKAIVVGHTPVKDMIVLGNHVYIDFGVCFYEDKPLTVYTYDEIINAVK